MKLNCTFTIHSRSASKNLAQTTKDREHKLSSPLSIVFLFCFFESVNEVKVKRMSFVDGKKIVYCVHSVQLQLALYACLVQSAMNKLKRMNDDDDDDKQNKRTELWNVPCNTNSRPMDWIRSF